MPKFSTRQHLAPDVAEEEVDNIGRAILIEQGRKNKLAIVGAVTRIYDQFVVGVTVTDHSGRSMNMHVPMDSPLAAGRTDPDAREVEWEADAVPITSDPAPVLVGEVEAGVSRAWLPAEVSQHGGQVRFRHNLGSEDVDVSAFDAGGAPIGYEIAVAIDANEQQIMLVPGTKQIQAVVTEPEETE